MDTSDTLIITVPVAAIESSDNLGDYREEDLNASIQPFALSPGT